MSGLNKTPTYFIEVGLGIVTGIAVFIYSHSHYKTWEFITQKDFTDRLLTVCIALFGFLLVILTLIIQNSGVIVTEMKKNSTYRRLINFNKKVIFLSAIVSLLSLFILFLKGILSAISADLFPILGCINIGLFVWVIVDTFIFVSIFYKIISKEVL